MAKRGVEGAYPLTTPVGGVFTPDNERRFRTLSAAQEAETLARLFVLEQKAGITGGPVDPAEGPYLPLRGGTMTGQIVLPGTPASQLGAVPRIYTDTADAALQTGINARLPLAGGTLTGFLLLHAAPTALLHAATKGYTDALDAAVRTAFAAADNVVRGEFQAADAALLTNINTRLPLAGGTLTGRLVTGSGVPATAPLRVPPGVAPTAPVNGDLWTTDAGVYAQINGQTVELATVGAPGAGIFLPLAGGVMTGRLETPSAVLAAAGFRIAQGVAPTAPVNGDIWITNSGIFAQIAGVTVRLGPNTGFSEQDLTGATTRLFTIPPEATEFTFSMIFATNGSNSPVSTITVNELTDGYQSMTKVSGAAYTPPVQDTTGIILPHSGASGPLSGRMDFRRSPASRWHAQGAFRRGSTEVLSVLNGQTPNPGSVPITQLRVRGNTAYTGGSARVDWRI